MYDLHMHTTFSDGKNSPEDMVLAAIDLGLEKVGISDHSITEFDPYYCMPFSEYEAYEIEVRRLKEKYSGRIKVLLGIEQDYYSPVPSFEPDYIIGSVHYVSKDGEYFPVDDTREKLLEASDTHFGGDIYALTGLYYETLCDVVNRTGCHIIGHFDLISKFNENGGVFDFKDPSYERQWRGAADALLKHDVLFEINTGGISRGFRNVPYPALDIIDYIKKKGGRFILSSDAHSAGDICFRFDEYKSLIL